MAHDGNGRGRRPTVRNEERGRERSSNREWDADGYTRISGPQFSWGLRVLERLALKGDEHALDAGCGSGRLTTELLRKLPRGWLVGCDLSENMVRAAAVTLEHEHPRRHAVVRADLVALPFRDSFDLVFSTATFHWIRDQQRLFESIFAALRTHGRLEAQCGGGANLRRIHDRALALARTPSFQPYFGSWTEPWEFATPDAAAARLRDAGFADVQCWIAPAPTRFADATAFREFLEKVVMRPFLARLPTVELRHRFLDTLTAAAAQDSPAFVLDYWRLNISAGKTLTRRRPSAISPKTHS